MRPETSADPDSSVEPSHVPHSHSPQSPIGPIPLRICSRRIDIVPRYHFGIWGSNFGPNPVGVQVPMYLSHRSSHRIDAGLKKARYVPGKRRDVAVGINTLFRRIGSVARR